MQEFLFLSWPSVRGKGRGAHSLLAREKVVNAHAVVFMS